MSARWHWDSASSCSAALRKTMSALGRSSPALPCPCSKGSPACIAPTPHPDPRPYETRLLPVRCPAEHPRLPRRSPRFPEWRNHPPAPMPCLTEPLNPFLVVLRNILAVVEDGAQIGHGARTPYGQVQQAVKPAARRASRTSVLRQRRSRDPAAGSERAPVNTDVMKKYETHGIGKNESLGRFARAQAVRSRVILTRATAARGTIKPISKAAIIRIPNSP